MHGSITAHCTLCMAGVDFTANATLPLFITRLVPKLCIGFKTFCIYVLQHLPYICALKPSVYVYLKTFCTYVLQTFPMYEQLKPSVHTCFTTFCIYALYHSRFSDASGVLPLSNAHYCHSSQHQHSHCDADGASTALCYICSKKHVLSKESISEEGGSIAKSCLAHATIEHIYE